MIGLFICFWSILVSFDLVLVSLVNLSQVLAAAFMTRTKGLLDKRMVGQGNTKHYVSLRFLPPFTGVPRVGQKLRGSFFFFFSGRSFRKGETRERG